MTRTPAVMEIELKPCPFCGGPPEAVEAVPGTWALGVTIRCGTSSCGAQQTGQTSQAAATKWNRRTPAEPLADGEMIEIVARAIGEAERTSCGGYPSTTDSDPKWNPWLTDKHRMFARAAIAAYNPNDRLREALEAGQEAYREGYHNGFLDAQVTDESGPFCSDDAILSRIDGVAMAEGWDAHSDTFAAALSHKD